MDFNLTLIGQTVAMIVFVWFCMKWIWPPVTAAIDKRRKEIADGIAAGEKGQKELADAHRRAEDILADARQRAVQVVDSRAQALERPGGRGQEPRDVRGRAPDRQARAEAVNEQARARDNLRKEVAALAVAGAAKVLGREVDAKTHAALLDELAAQLEQQAPSRG